MTVVNDPELRACSSNRDLGKPAHAQKSNEFRDRSFSSLLWSSKMGTSNIASACFSITQISRPSDTFSRIDVNVMFAIMV